MKIFLDDIRNPQDCLSYMHTRIGKLNSLYLEKWLTVRNYNDFIKCVKENCDTITHISFDHDLADEHYDHLSWGSDMYIEKTGLDCAKWLHNYYKEINTDLPILFIHSMNIVGMNNIINLFNDKYK